MITIDSYPHSCRHAPLTPTVLRPLLFLSFGIFSRDWDYPWIASLAGNFKSSDLVVVLADIPLHLAALSRSPDWIDLYICFHLRAFPRPATADPASATSVGHGDFLVSPALGDSGNSARLILPALRVGILRAPLACCLRHMDKSRTPNRALSYSTCSKNSPL